MAIETRVAMVSPKVAAELLAQPHVRQRPLRQGLVRRYAAVMRRGDWHLTHQGIALDETGKLLDGQHRLAAVVMSGMTVRMMVTYGLDADRFDVMDTGAKRTSGDIIKMAGFSNGPGVSAVVRLVIAYDELPDMAWTGIVYQEATSSEHRILEVFEQDAERYEEAVRIGASMKGAMKSLLPSAAATWAYVAMRAEKDGGRNREEFVHGLLTGENLKHGDPRLLLRRMYLRERSDKKTTTKQY